MPKVMLVEDDNNLSEIYQARMQAEGYQIVAAHDGEEALAVAAKEKPDLIISDVMMPKISGFEMLDILRNTEGLKDTKVIMLTALGQAEDRTRADSLGANKYLVKSQVTLEDIVTAAHELLDTPQSSAPTATAETTEAVSAAPSIPTVSPGPTATDIGTAPTKSLEPTAPFMPTPPVTPATLPPAASPAPITAPLAPVDSPAPTPTPPSTSVLEPAAAAPTPTPPVTPAAVQTPVSMPVITPPAPVQAENAAPANIPSAPEPKPVPVPTTIVTPPSTPTAAPAPVQPPQSLPLPDSTPPTPAAALTDQAAAPPAPVLSTPTPPEAPAAVISPTPPSPAAGSSLDDQRMSAEIAKLLAVTGEPSEAPKFSPEASARAVLPTPTTPPTNTPNTPAPSVNQNATPAPGPDPLEEDSENEVTRKRVIQPINDPTSKPDLKALLAAEEAKNAPQMPQGNRDDLTADELAPFSAPKPAMDRSHQPGIIVAPEPKTPTATTPAPEASVATPADPNSISL